MATRIKTAAAHIAEPCWIGIYGAIEVTKAAAGPSSTRGYVVGTFLQAMRSGMVGFCGAAKKRRQDAAFWQNAVLENVFDDQGKIVNVCVAHTFPEPDTEENAGSPWRRAHTVTCIGTAIDQDDLACWLERHLRREGRAGIWPIDPVEHLSKQTLGAVPTTTGNKTRTSDKLDQKYKAIVETLEDGVRPTGPHKNVPNTAEWLYRVQLKMRPDLFQNERSNSVRLRESNSVKKTNWPARKLKDIGLNRRTVDRALKKLAEENDHVKELLQEPGILPDLGDHPYPYP
jgi:hypothetical protein